VPISRSISARFNGTLLPVRHDPMFAQCLFDRQAIEVILDAQATLLNQRYAASRPLVLCVMTGALVYAGHLLPRLSFTLDLDYVHASRYGMDRHGGALDWIARPRIGVANREVLLLDDILDEGITLNDIRQWLYAEGATQVEIAVLTHKAKSLPQPCQPDYPALVTPDRYVYGFGLDVDGLWRNADGIFVAPTATA
jgi:hypoxanthine phosphoribosyltransferase